MDPIDLSLVPVAVAPPQRRLEELHQQADRLSVWIDDQIRLPSSPSQWLKLYALRFFRQDEVSPESWAFALQRGAEACALRISTDERFSAATRQRFAPQYTSSGINSSYTLSSTDPTLLASEELWATAPLAPTCVYKPRQQVLGGLDAPIVYEDAQQLHRLKGEQHNEEIHLLTDDRKKTIAVVSTTASELPDELKIDSQSYRRIQRSRKVVTPGMEVLGELVYYWTARYCQDQAPVGTVDFSCVPQTTLESFSHPLFGPHHKVGTRHAFVVGAHHFPTSSPGAAIKKSNLLPIAFLDLLTANIGRHLGNLLVRDRAVHHIDGGYALPHVDRATDMLEQRIMLEWRDLSIGESRFPPEWTKLAQGIDAQELLAYLQVRLTAVNTQFPSETLAISHEQALLLYSTSELLRQGTARGLTLGRLAYFLAYKKIRGADGEEKVMANGRRFHPGAELWILLRSQLSDANEVPRIIQKLLDCEPVLRTYSEALLSVRLKISPEEFLRRALEGDFRDLVS